LTRRATTPGAPFFQWRFAMRNERSSGFSDLLVEAGGIVLVCLAVSWALFG
jgi:hypothetical protein